MKSEVLNNDLDTRIKFVDSLRTFADEKEKDAPWYHRSCAAKLRRAADVIEAMQHEIEELAQLLYESEEQVHNLHASQRKFRAEAKRMIEQKFQERMPAPDRHYQKYLSGEWRK